MKANENEKGNNKDKNKNNVFWVFDMQKTKSKTNVFGLFSFIKQELQGNQEQLSQSKPKRDRIQA